MLCFSPKKSKNSWIQTTVVISVGGRGEGGYGKVYGGINGSGKNTIKVNY